MTEQEKYTKAWQIGAEGASRTALPVFNVLKKILNKNDKILELGCGNGMVTEFLRQEGFNIYGIDITLEGLKQHTPIINHYPKITPIVPQKEYYIESPLWETPFKDNEFDFTFSVDVLEHLPPELVKQSITEIIRITKTETRHYIATFADNREEFVFHLTVHPIIWWIQEFNKYNNKNIKFSLIDRKDFLGSL